MRTENRSYHSVQSVISRLPLVSCRNITAFRLRAVLIKLEAKKMEDEVVISGIAGRFPACDNVESLKELLFNKISGVTSDNRRWDKGDLGVPHHLGKINDPYCLDLTFFGVSSKLGESMDPQTKLVMEVGYSAICDAGINPSDLAGSNTATLIGSSLAETEYECIITKNRLDQTILSHAVSMQAHRIAYYLDLRGPSYVCDSSWNGGLYALRYAKDQIARGMASAALVACTNLIFMPQVSYHYNRLGRLNEDGKTKCFSDDADGYTRSEGCVAFFLQRKEHALRNYGTVIGVNSSLYASKNSPLSDCSDIPIARHLKNLYQKSKIDPSEISYLEASGCASKIVDAAELNAVSEIFLAEKKEPLLIGSIKSNVGHTEAASGCLGVLKTIIAAECGMIPPNIYYSSPNSLVPSLVSGKLEVVTEPTPLKGDYLAVNNISAAGDFGHVIIRRNPKIKKRQPEVGVLPPDGLPRLVLLSGRVENGLADIMQMVEEMPIDEEFIALTHKVFGKGIKNHIFRGFTILDNDSSKKYSMIQPFHGGEKRPLWFVFTGMGSQHSNNMAGDLMKLPIFAKSVQFCHDELKHLGINVMEIVTSTDKSIFNNVLNAFVGITTIQVALIDLIKELGLEPDGIIGHSFGELACSYYDGSVTAHQAILAAYNRGKISIEAKVDPGLMAAVGLGYENLKKFGLPDAIDVACHNSQDSCTISGPFEDVKKFVGELQEKGIFARSVATGGIAYHSRYIQSLGQQFRDSLKEIIPVPKVRSSKWISSSVPEDKWESDLGKYSSAEYHTNNLLNSVLFEEACAHIPKNAIVIEIAPHGLLQAILKRMLPEATHIPLTNRAESDNLKFLLSAFGKMFTEGVQFDIQKLYPPVEFPVSRGTPSLASLLTWNNAGTFRPWTFLQRRKNVEISKKITFSNSNNKHKKFTKCYLNGTPIILNAAYINTVLEEYLKFKNGDPTKIIFQGLQFKNLIKYEGDTSVFMTFQRGCGEWEICKENSLIAFGKIDTFLQGYNKEPLSNMKKTKQIISAHQVYSYLSSLGYTVHSELQLINHFYLYGNEVEAEIKWTGDWLSFFDAIFKIVEYFESVENNVLALISDIERITIDLSSFPPEGGKVCSLMYNKKMGLIWGQGIEILLPCTRIPNMPLQNLSTIEKATEFLLPKFIPYLEVNNTTENEFFETCLLIVLDNLYTKNNETFPKLHVIKILENISSPNVVNDILRKQNNIEVKISTVASDTMLLNTDLKENIDSFSLIISGSNMLENTLKVLNNSAGGFLIYKGTRAPTSLAIITKQNIKNETYFFCKTVQKQEGPSFIIHDNNWKINLINHLNQDKPNLCYFVNKYSSLAAIHDIIEQTASFKNSHLLRFLFTDSGTSLLKLDKYQNYIKKDLRINIFLNGKWGTSLLTEFKLKMSPPIGNINVFQFLHIKCPDLELHSLGLNPVIKYGDKQKNMLFEYSGVRQGKELCGLATMREGNFHLQLDPHFMWLKPKNWNHDDISSILVIYTLAYYILEEKTDLKYVNTILVHEGITPLSQAIINLAIKRNLKVFTTYDGKPEHKEYLKKKYPQIDEDNILNFNQSQLEVPFLLKTMGEGFDVVVNTLPDIKKLRSTIKCLGKCAQRFFQVSIPSIESTFSIGLGIFLSGVGLHCIYPETLLTLPIQTKIFLRDLVNNGLENREIQPISYSRISSAALNIDVTSLVKYDVKKKLVVAMKDHCIATAKTNVHIFDSSKLYLILGNQEDGWLKLLEWLLSRGVRKLVLCISSLSTVAAQKLNTILMINNHVTVTTCTSKKLDSSANIKKFISRFGNCPEIDTAFIIGEESQNTMNQLATNLPNTRFIVICNESGICQENQNINSKILIIKTTKCLDYNELLKAMDSLMDLSEPVVYIKHYEKNKLDMDSSTLQHWQHVPTSLKEIASFASCSNNKSFWKELRTSSYPYKYCKETSPVFILPSLKKGQMKELISSLFHPAFEAVLPTSFESADDLAEQLLAGLKKFSNSVFTIICSDWMCMLGLKLGTLLEKSGKKVSLILLGISPEWAKPESVRRVYDQVIKDTPNDDLEAYNQVDLEKGLELLQERVRLISSPPSLLNNVKFKGFCHLISFKKTTDSSLQLLSKSCQRNVNVLVVNEDDYLSMLRSNVTTNFINSNILFECKDGARLIPKGYENVLAYNLSYTEE